MRIKFSLKALLFLLSLLAAWPLAVKAQPSASAPVLLAQARPKICLVLSGGGARGAAHVGVLQVLERMRVPIDCVAGTSMGAIVGAAYAAGHDAAELAEAISGMTTEKLMTDAPPRRDKPMLRKADDEREFVGPELGLQMERGLMLPKGAVSGTALEAVLRALTASPEMMHFDTLPTPFRAVATDLVSGQMRVMQQGNLARVIRASMSVPGAIAPVELDGQLLVDGGLVRNLPVDVARAMGAEVVIAVNLGTSLMARDEIQDALGVASQMLNILTEQNVQASLSSLTSGDVLIAPQLGKASAADFTGMGKLIALGEAAALQQQEKLQALALSADAYALWLQSRAKRTAAMHAGMKLSRPIAKIEIEGVQRVNPQTMLASLKTPVGQALDTAVLDADLRNLYGWGDFERLNYVLRDDAQGQRVLVIEAQEKSWGPSYLRFGLGLEARLGGGSAAGSAFDIALHTRRTWLNQLGAEWRAELQLGQHTTLATEWVQPLDTRRIWFVDLAAKFALRPVAVFEGAQQLASFSNRTTGMRVDFGRNFGNKAQLRLGVEKGGQRYVKDVGDVSLPDSLRARLAGLHLRFDVDTLNSGTFASEGERLQISLEKSMPTLGADAGFVRWQAQWRHAAGTGAHVWHSYLAAGGRLGAQELPVHAYFSMGGDFRLSAYPQGRFSGPGYAYAGVLYAHRVLDVPLLRGAYLGFKLDAARVKRGNLNSENISNLVSAGPFFTLDSPLGPFFVGLHFAPNGQRSASLWLGALR